MREAWHTALIPALGLAVFALAIAVLGWLSRRDRRRSELPRQFWQLEERIRRERLPDEERAWRHVTEGEREQARVAYALLCRGEEA